MDELAKFESRLMEGRTPAAVLLGMNSSNFEEYSAKQLAQIYVTIWRTIKNQLPMNYPHFVTAFHNYVGLALGDAPDAPDGVIAGFFFFLP